MSIFALLGLLLAIAALAFVLYPLLKPIPARAAVRPESSELGEQREELYRQIVDLEFDQRIGKLDESDAKQLREELLRQAAQLLAQESNAEQALAAEIELEILRIRATAVIGEGSEGSAVEPSGLPKA